MQNSYSEYDEDCLTEEKSLFEEEKSHEIAEINLLFKEPEHTTENITNLENEDLEVL